MFEQVGGRDGKHPNQWLVDGAYLAHEQIEQAAAHSIVYASVPKPKDPSTDPYPADEQRPLPDPRLSGAPPARLHLPPTRHAPGGALSTSGTADPPALSIVIPVYNSAPGLPLLAERLARVLDGLGRTWEVILVCDSSPDGSWRVIEGLVAARAGFRGILLARNMGQARATLCGIRAATGDTVVTMDDDLQHEPDALPTLLAALDSDDGYDAVFAWFPEKQHAGWRNAASRLVAWLNARAFGLGGLRLSAYRLMRRPVADFIRANHASSVATPGALILAATRHVKSVPIPHQARAFGCSNYTLARQLRLALNNLIGVSLLPLRLIAGLGIATAGLSALMVLVTLVRYFTTGFGVPGWATLVILITFFSGLILLSLGVIGEYLVRVLRELQYADAVPVRRTVGF